MLFTYQCKKYLNFSDTRIVESGRLIVVDGEPDHICSFYFIDPTMSNVFPKAYQGIQKIGSAMENCTNDKAYFVTSVDAQFFTESVIHITHLRNGYDLLCDKDSRTSNVPQSFGEPDQWNYALHLMGTHGNWSTLIEDFFGSEINLSHAISGYSLFDKQKKWLYFIVLSIFGVKDNEYLQLAVNNTSNSENLIKSIFRSILTVNKNDSKFSELYKQRKALIHELKDVLSDTIDYCKVISVKGEDAIYYLTDLSQFEKERIIAWLDTYGSHYSPDQLMDILMTVYPDLSSYLTKFRFKNELLDNYFESYKYQKLINKILPSFEAIVDEQSKEMDFVSTLKPRASFVDKLDVKNSKAFFFDALGVEYLGYIQEKCKEYNLSANISYARCELPSLTLSNKEFVDTLTGKGCSISDIKELDEIKHHGEDSFDYEKEKTPIYLIKELEIIDELLIKIRASINSDQYEKAIIISDHGASRLAVLHETENVWSMATSGEHSGRCCKISEIDSKPDFAIEESDFWILTNYDRFKGGRRANVEVHGGASIEEVTVPIIEITKKNTDVEAFIVDTSRILMLGAKEHATIQIYVGVKSSNITIKLDGIYYDAEPTGNSYVYSVDLEAYSKKGKFSFDIYNGSDVLAVGQVFEIKKKGISETNLFD